MTQRLGREYDEMAALYADHAADSAYNAHYDRPAVLDLCGDVAGRRVLDAACGPGFYAQELLDRGAEVVGFDASAAMLELARARLGDRVALHQAALGDRLPFDDASFDLVVCALAIHYADDREATLREFRRVLVTDGAVVVSTQHPTSDWLRKGGSYFDVVVETDTWTGMAEERDVSFWREPLSSFTDACFRAGFLIERLVEPMPSASMRERWPDDHAKLSREPAFLVLRLVPARATTSAV